MRSSIIILKPPAVPIPCTAGGGITSTSPPFTACSAGMSSEITCGARAVRSWCGFSPKKITPALGALVKVAPSSPAKPTDTFTAGLRSEMAIAWRITASVRCSELPGGSCTTPIR